MNRTRQPQSLLRAAIILMAAGVAACAMPAPVLEVDTIYLNGQIVTMDAEARTVEAVAVRGDEIVGVGSNTEIGLMAGPGTRVVDLEGRAMTPGFYAPHDHFPWAGAIAVTTVNLNSPPMGPVQNIDGLVDALREKAAETPAGDWIQGWGYDDTLIEDQRHPTRHDLDRVSTEHPIYISHTSGHLGVANTMALGMARITADTQPPPGGVIRHEADTDEPDGVLEETAAWMVMGIVPPATVEQKLEGFRRAVQIYVEQGVTTTVITGGTAENVIDLQMARREGLLSLRVVTMVSKAAPGFPSPAEAGGFVSGFGDNRLKLGGIKIVQDGSNQGFTGYFTEPYHTPFNGDSEWRGYPARSREDLTAMVKGLHRAGYQIAIHGNGDAAIDDIIHAFREAQRDFPREDARHRIEHCQMVRKDQLDEIAELGITPSFFVGHVFYWGDRHRDIFMGPERAAGISPLKSSIDRGIRFTVHDDTPVTPVDPLQLIWVSVNRRTRSDQVLGPEERVSPLEAMRAMTLDAAWQNFEEDIKGSIEPGKLADLVILSDNPLTVDPLTIREIDVLETIVGGETVYLRGD
ncbi:MAG: amidohydrolase [Gammaproteobacteria bacterium]|nr:amidohydrolase [Gammaproteobacteria bacterium]MYC50988.1 amidohydrolase [Gammaproteobacteria bacterium]